MKKIHIIPRTSVVSNLKNSCSSYRLPFIKTLLLISVTALFSNASFVFAASAEVGIGAENLLGDNKRNVVPQLAAGVELGENSKNAPHTNVQNGLGGKVSSSDNVVKYDTDAQGVKTGTITLGVQKEDNEEVQPVRINNVFGEEITENSKFAVTGGQLFNAQKELGGKIGSVQEELGGKIGAVQEELGSKIGAVQEELGGKIGAVQEELGGKIGAVQEELGGKIGAVQEELGSKIGVVQEELGGKIGAVQEELGGKIGAVQEELGGKIGAV
ncbi:hypothetical protein MCY_01307, partial [Bartonella rattimassiliensis 15908]